MNIEQPANARVLARADDHSASIPRKEHASNDFLDYTTAETNLNDFEMLAPVKCEELQGASNARSRTSEFGEPFINELVENTMTCINPQDMHLEDLWNVETQVNASSKERNSVGDSNDCKSEAIMRRSTIDVVLNNVTNVAYDSEMGDTYEMEPLLSKEDVQNTKSGDRSKRDSQADSTFQLDTVQILPVQNSTVTIVSGKATDEVNRTQSEEAQESPCDLQSYMSDSSDIHLSENEEEEDQDFSEMEHQRSTPAQNCSNPQTKRHQSFNEDSSSGYPPPSSIPLQQSRIMTQPRNELGYKRREVPKHVHQQLRDDFDPSVPSFAADHSFFPYMQNEHSRQSQAHFQKRTSNIQGAQSSGQQQFATLERSGPNMAPWRLLPPSLPPVPYQWSPQAGHPYAGMPHHPMSNVPRNYFAPPYHQMHPNSAYPILSQPGFSNFSQPFMPQRIHDWMQDSNSELPRPAITRPARAAQNHVEEDSSSDDDEPLKTRVKRYQSISSGNSTLVASPSANFPNAETKNRGHRRGLTSHVESEGVVPRSQLDHARNPVRMQRSLPQAVEISDPASSGSVLENEIGSWALPRFEVQRQPVDKKDEIPSVKVSLPNLVREELLLSPDHADQEIHLLLNLFIPGQQALTTPDPEPATAVLNFHTIAIMVVEAFVQFEIGDEMSHGPSVPRGLDNGNSDAYARQYEAKDANVDEIFFAVVDRWRAGLESKKQSLSLIRGVQEFCDVALDVIYYIKEHGLLKPEEKKKRAKPDAGTKNNATKVKKETAKVKIANQASKGKKKVDAVEKASGKQLKGVKREASPKVNVLQSRKKAKTVKVTKSDAKPRAKPKTKGVTVIMRKK